MSRDRRVMNIEPGDVELEWDGMEPVLVLREYRNRAIIKVRVRIGMGVGQQIARLLHGVVGSFERRASDLLKSLRGVS